MSTDNQKRSRSVAFTPEASDCGATFSDLTALPSSFEDEEVDSVMSGLPKDSPECDNGAESQGERDHETLKKAHSYFSKLHEILHHSGAKICEDRLSSSDGLLSPSKYKTKRMCRLTPPLSSPSNRRISAPPHSALHRLRSKGDSPLTPIHKRRSATPVFVHISSTAEDEDPSSEDLRQYSRKFGSTGNLLEMTDGHGRTNLVTKRHLGKSLQLLPTCSSGYGSNSELGPFRVETGLECKRGQICSLQALSLHEHALLENPECETRWYFKYFLGKYHCNYLCYDWDKNPIFLSIVSSDSMDSIYRCIVWKRTGNKRLSVKHDSKGKWPSPKTILEKCSVKVDRNIKEIHSPAIQKDLLTLEEQEGSVSFKFGVLYAKAGQRTDDEMYCNRNGSERFQQFLELLGDEVQLQGWEQFRGGLDCKNDSTGLSSVYTAFEGHEIMFHVSTLLPYTAGNRQQLERKRHIGNDIVVIIFVDYDTKPEDAYRSALMDFDPSRMRSHFNHIFALVSYNPLTECYHLIIYSAESVPAFGPPLPYKGEFPNNSAFRDFLLAKLINGEKAAYCTPTFSEKRERTLGLLLKGFEQDYNHEMRRASSTPALNHSPSTYKKFNEREQVFTEYGQRLKVQKIITGHHPTSQRTTVAPKREPWETECVAENFPYKINHGDVCDEGTLIVSTPSNGSNLIYRDGGYSQIMDQSISVGQLVVAHRHNLLLFRTNFTKEVNYMYAIPLKELFTQTNCLVKQNLSRYQIPHSKHVSLFCTSPLTDQFLRLAVAVKTKVYMIAYKHPASMVVNGSPVTPLTSMLPKDTFIKHRELSLLDVPAHMALLDERPSGKLCVTYQKLMVVDAIDEIRATTQRIPNVDVIKSKVTSLTSVHTNGHGELLIGYNLTCQLVTLHESTAYNTAEIMWNTEPRDLVYLHPYMLAFTEHSIEIRMAANGSLMQTISVPDLQLLSSKGDLYFTSSSARVGTSSSTNTARGSALLTHSMSQPPSKFPKNIDKRDFMTSSKFNDCNVDATYVYKIYMESMTGRRDSETPALGSSVSLRNSLSDDSISRAEVMSIASSDDCTSDGSTLDFIHPKDDDIPIIHTSFEEEDTNMVFAVSKHNHNIHHHHQYHLSKGLSSRNISRETSLSLPQHRNHMQPTHKSVEARSNSFGPTNSSIDNGSNGGLYDSQFSAPSHSPISPLNEARVSPPHSTEHPPFHVKIKRSKKVLTSRKSLESGSRWLHPSPEHFHGAHRTMMAADGVAGGNSRYGHNMVELLGAMDNACSSPDSGVHDDFSLPSNYSEPNSNSAL